MWVVYIHSVFLGLRYSIFDIWDETGLLNPRSRVPTIKSLNCVYSSCVCVCVTEDSSGEVLCLALFCLKRVAMPEVS